MTSLLGYLAEMNVALSGDAPSNPKEPNVGYSLDWGKDTAATPLNEHLGKTLTLQHTGKYACGHCGKSLSKPPQGGYCYPCFISLPQCDLCYVKPELCHHHLGTCRDPQWGTDTCFAPHYLYLSHTSSPKVGITRKHRYLQRWMEQGANMGILLALLPNRKESGQAEVALKHLVADKTNWRKMLQACDHQSDMTALAREILTHLNLPIPAELPVQHLHYPILKHPEKVNSLSLDKTPRISSKLLGMKAQYLILEEGVFNMKKHNGYEVEFQIH